MVKRYIWNFLIAVDQLVNTITGGDPDETISSRAGKRQNDCKFCFYLCRFLDLFQKDHCTKSIETDEGERSSAPF
jgi:hypothetical protein